MRRRFRLLAPRFSQVLLTHDNALAIGTHHQKITGSLLRRTGFPLMAGNGMIVINLAVGILTMMLCLILQVSFTMWSFRYALSHAGEPGSGRGLFPGIRRLLMAMVIMMLGKFLQIMLWGALFLWLGEFTEVAEAVYHSGVNFTSLGYGDVVMSAHRKLLGPLDALNGISMLGLTSAALVGILQPLTRGHRATSAAE